MEAEILLSESPTTSPIPLHALNLDNMTSATELVPDMTLGSEQVVDSKLSKQFATAILEVVQPPNGTDRNAPSNTRTPSGGIETSQGTIYVSKPVRSGTSKKLRAVVAFTPRKSHFDLANEQSGSNEFRVRPQCLGSP